MDKDFNLKNDPYYSKSHLRQKIDESIKRQRDEACEVKEDPVKVLREGPRNSNRDANNLIKHYRNKFISH